MAIEIKLPNLGDGIDTGDVLELLVKEGDIVAKDQGIIELETGKATMQVPCSAAGKILKVHVAAGQTIPVGAPLLTLDAVGAEPAAPKAAPQKAPPAAAKPPVAATAPQPVSAPAPVAPKAAPAVAPPTPVAASAPAPVAKAAPPKAVPVPVPVAAEAPTVDPSSPVAAGPAVRRFAREVGVDLGRVTGSGASGRITREDILAVVRQASQSAASAKPTSATARDAWGPIRPERMTKIRKLIAAKMHESWMTCPRVTNFDDADVTELERLRVSSKDDYAKKGIKLTTLPFVIKAVASALKNHPSTLR